MQQFASLQAAQLDTAWLTIGAFDGVHLGHQAILRNLVLKAHANQAPAVVFTFHPHPLEALRGPRQAFYLSAPEEKAELIAALGVDALIIQPFTEQFSRTSAEDFVRQLKDRLGLQELWVGPDFALGHRREGDVAALQRYGRQMGFAVHSMATVELDGARVSSSRIRSLLALGQVAEAERFLGRPFAVIGAAAPGAGTLGVPTIGVPVWPKRAALAAGVYAAWAQVEGERWGALAQVAAGPEAQDQSPGPVVETHILDYDGESFFGREVRLEFIARLRDAMPRAASDPASQTQQDIQRAREVLAQAD